MVPLETWLGTWQLDPATLRYEHGRPGRRALYTIERADEGLTFHLDAEDPDGKRLRFTYGGPLDGVGRVVDHWRCELAPDGGSITFTQNGTTPDGHPFKNVSVYFRLP